MTENLKIDRPIVGDVERGDRRQTPQLSASEFLDKLDAVFAIEGVKAVRWDQYTPYFNDGDPCEFGADELRIQFTNAAEDAGDYEDGFVDLWSVRYVNGAGEHPYRPEGVSDETAQALKESDFNLDSFESVIRENFGEHAQVTATSEGFAVEYYEHD